MIRAVIIDDEPSSINVVKLLLQKHVPAIKEVYTAIGAAAGIQCIKERNPHLVFLDIEMPLMNGFELLEEFKDHSFEIIFITAYDQYAIKAIKFSALDYLLKPIDAEELKEAVARFFVKFELNQSQKPSYENLMYNLNQQPADYKLAIATLEGTSFYPVTDIIRCEAVSNYTKFFFKDKKPVITSKTLKEYEDLLADQHFLRVHRAHLVNQKYIVSLSRDHEIKMNDGSLVQVSRRKWDGIKEKIRC